MGKTLFLFRVSGRAAPPENIAPFDARAAARHADPQNGGVSVYQLLASESWCDQQADLQRQLVGMGQGDLACLDVILSAVEAFWLAAGFEPSHITLRTALGWELLRQLDWRSMELRRSLLVFLSMNHCPKGEQVITDGNLCDVGLCLSTEMTFGLLERAYANGGFGPDVKGVVLTFNGTPVCERDPKSGCGCAAPKPGDETAAVRSFIAFQLELMRTFLGDDVLTAVMVAYTPHADPATTGLATAVPVGSVTLSQAGAGSTIEVTVGLAHPAGINNDVARAMGTGGDERREASREAAKERVIDAVAAVDRWAAALAVVRDQRPPPVGSSAAPGPVSLDAVSLAVPRPADIAHDELDGLFINPSKASGKGGPSHACARRSGRKHERRALQVCGASSAKNCTRRIAAARVSADIRPEVPFDTPTLARAHTAHAERPTHPCRAPAVHPAG